VTSIGPRLDAVGGARRGDCGHQSATQQQLSEPYFHHYAPPSIQLETKETCLSTPTLGSRARCAAPSTARLTRNSGRFKARQAKGPGVRLWPGLRVRSGARYLPFDAWTRTCQGQLPAATPNSHWRPSADIGEWPVQGRPVAYGSRSRREVKARQVEHFVSRIAEVKLWRDNRWSDGLQNRARRWTHAN
jgi:hypothetical protein